MLASSLLAAALAVGTTADNHFSPADITVTQGDTVTWNLPEKHNVHFSGEGPSPFGGTYRKTFNDTGIFKYVCDAHAPDMRGTVTVAAASQPSPSGSPEVGAVTPGPPATLVRSIRMGRRHVRFLTNQSVSGQVTVLKGRKIIRFVRFAGEAPLVKANFRSVRPTHYRVVLRVNGDVFRKTILVK